MVERRICLWAFSISLLSLVGCGGNSLSPVTGEVTYGGEPIADGEIRFIPQTDSSDGPGITGAKITDGTYSVPAQKGVLAGTSRVEIYARKNTGRKLKAVPPAPIGSLIDESIQYIPRDYNTASTLTVEIKAGANEFDFDLEPL